MATLKEHIEFLQKFYFYPNCKAGIIRYLCNVFREHFSVVRDKLMDTSNHEELTVDEFIDQIIVYPQVAKAYGEARP